MSVKTIELAAKVGSVLISGVLLTLQIIETVKGKPEEPAEA